MADKLPDLRAARADFTAYIAEKSRYISISEQQGPLRPGESKLRAPRRQYIKNTLQWDEHKACWLNRDRRSLIKRDNIWTTIIGEMRQLDTHGQRKVWGVVQEKFDGIHEEDVRAACKAWSKHRLYLLKPNEDSQWDITPEAQANTIHPVDPLSIHDPGLGDTGDMRVEEHLSSSTEVVTHPPELLSRSFKGQKSVEGSNLEQDSCQINSPPSAISQAHYDLPDDNYDDPKIFAPEEETINTERAESKNTPRAPRSESQYLQSVSVPLRDPVIEKVSRKQVRRANSTEKLQEYTQNVMEQYAKRSIGQAKIGIEGLRGAGTGIYASNLKSFAQETAERVSRARELAEFVDNIQPKPSKRGQKTTSRHTLRSPSPVEDEDDSNDDEDDDDDDEDNEDDKDDVDDDEDDVDDDGDYRLEYMLRREGEEMNAKHLRLRTYYGAVSAYQATYGPMPA